MSFSFTPTEDVRVAKVPYFEEARADLAPYYDNFKHWTVKKAQQAVQDEIVKLEGTVTGFIAGVFEDPRPRYGYRIEFVFKGAPGRINLAGLPLRHTATQRKIDGVRVQALLNVRDWLKTQVTSMIFSPGNNPLIPHLLGPGNRTMAEFIADRASLDIPLLLGEIVEEGQ